MTRAAGRRRSASEAAGWPLALYTALACAFILAPILVVLASSFTAAEYTSFPPRGLSLRWYVEILDHEEFLESLRVSAGVAVAAAAAALVVGTLVALALARYRFPGRTVLGGLFMSPLLLPSLILGIALLQFYTWLGVTKSWVTLVLGHVVLTTPYVIRLVGASLAGFRQELERAAQNLGATRAQTFRWVTLPLIRPGLLAGAAFAAIISFDDVNISLFLASPKTVTLPVRIFSYIEQTFDPLVTAVSSLLILISTVAIVALEWTIGVGRLFGAESRQARAPEPAATP